MTDPKELQGLIGAIRSPDFRVVDMIKVATALDAYARILAASPDVRGIEERHAKRQASCELLGMPMDPEIWPAIREHCDVGTLLDAVRRKDATAEGLRDALRREETAHLATMAELDEARTALAEEREKSARLEAELRERPAGTCSTPACNDGVFCEGECWKCPRCVKRMQGKAEQELAEERERHAGTRAVVEELTRITDDAATMLCEHFGDRIYWPRDEIPAGIQSLTEQIQDECKETAAAEKRAGTLAEGVRLYRELCADYEVCMGSHVRAQVKRAVAVWERSEGVRTENKEPST